MSGTGTSSRTRALPYSCMRAAFMSAFLSKWWVFKIQVSLGGWRRSVFGDDHHLLVNKFLDAVLWGYPLLLPIVSLGSLATRTRWIGRLCLVTKCSDSRLCNRNVLFNGAGTCSDRTDFTGLPTPGRRAHRQHRPRHRQGDHSQNLR